MIFLSLDVLTFLSMYILVSGSNLFKILFKQIKQNENIKEEL